MIAVPEDLADLLLLWWIAERGADLAQLGMPRECPSTRGYRPRGRDSEDLQEAATYLVVVQAVQFAVDALEGPERAAAHVLARNLATGADVWASSRIPPGEAGRLVFERAVDRLSQALGLTEGLTKAA